ncbi:F-box protein CPR30-like [Pyrus ussuriensis x Pyrus communis]|uniref:F-box protein CPR30-like n=1 Tax=Pyrus ussuriensis x Pyrus communis TaxID=2448454 RepID=A0A5N5FUM3_9ROSA|nr:F-box protein CPR1-like [Pyrus x bretschneideri]KAB2604882.1 F-box protein CPR30-like [Pyrus ussuriensis x Pyrus communis]
MKTAKYKCIPSGVLANILFRLPVKSLKRFECVCRYWYDLIKDPSFTIQHLHHSKNVNQHFLLQKGIRYGHVSLLCLDEISLLSRHRLNLPSVFSEILGPCNGIYCFIRLNVEFELDLIALANVSLREFKVVPDLSIAHPHSERQSVKLYGFGFDRKTNDYKLVLILSCTDRKGIEFDCKEVVYSLRSNSWREIDRTFPYAEVTHWPSPFFKISYWPYLLTSDSGTYVNGNSHWLVSDTAHWLANNVIRYIIRYFDMADEVFRWISLPKLLESSSYGDMDVNINALYTDSLSVVVRPKSYIPDKTCEVWIMHDYGDDESWTKLVTIGQIEGIARSLKLLGFWHNGEFLFEYDEQEVISYNPNTQKISQKFRVCGSLRAYTESLVSIIGDQLDDQNMLFDIVKESDDPTLQQPTSS